MFKQKVMKDDYVEFDDGVRGRMTSDPAIDSITKKQAYYGVGAWKTIKLIKRNVTHETLADESR